MILHEQNLPIGIQPVPPILVGSRFDDFSEPTNLLFYLFQSLFEQFQLNIVII